MVPTQQLVLTTYIFLFLLAIESIAVFHIVCRYEKKQETKASRQTWCSTSYATDMCMPLVRVPAAAGQQLWKQARACLLPRVVQKRKEAWRRYCKLRDQGKLEGGQNPTLASAASAPQAKLDLEQQEANSSGIGGEEKVAGSRPGTVFACSTCFGARQQEGHHVESEAAAESKYRRKSFGIFFHSTKKADRVSAPERGYFFKFPEH